MEKARTGFETEKEGVVVQVLHGAPALRHPQPEDVAHLVVYKKGDYEGRTSPRFEAEFTPKEGPYNVTGWFGDIWGTKQMEDLMKEYGPILENVVPFNYQCQLQIQKYANRIKAKRPYQKPKVKKLGNLRDLVR